MASVTLTGLWVHDVADPSTPLQLSLRGLVETPARQGERRTYAGGRTRAVTRPATTLDIEVTVGWVARADVDRFRGLLGTLLMVRDQRGRKRYGVVWRAPITEWATEDLAEQVQFTVEQISHDEAV